MEIDFATRHLQSKLIKSKNEWKYAKWLCVIFTSSDYYETKTKVAWKTFRANVDSTVKKQLD